MAVKKGFTLVELVVTLGVFGVIMIVGANFLIQMIRSAGQAAVQNEVRQNASVILQDIAAQIRQGSCAYYESPSPPGVNNALLRLSDDPSGVKCATGNRVEYHQDRNGVVTRAATDSGGTALSFGALTSVNAAVLDCSASGLACGLVNAGDCAAGLTAVSSGIQTTVTVRAQQLPGQTRPDFCAAVKLADTVSFRPR